MANAIHTMPPCFLEAGALKPKPTDKTTAIVENVIYSLLSVGGAVAGPAAPALGSMAAIFSFGTTLANTLEGNSTIDISTTVGEIADQAVSHFNQQQTTLGTMYDVIYEDYGKFQNLGTKLKNAGQGDPWFWDSSNDGLLLNSLANVAEASIYRGIMPTIFARGIIPSFYEPTPLKYTNVFDAAGEQTPFAHYTDIEYQSSEQPGLVWDIRVLAFKGTETDDETYNTAPATIFNRLFNSPDDNGLGVYQSYFYRRWEWPTITCVTRPPHMNELGGCDFRGAK